MNSSILELALSEKDKHLFYALGRNAMYAACEAFGIQEGDEVLTPAFDCDGALQPFRVKQCSFKFYKIDPLTFNIDIEDIKKKIGAKTRLVHIINYFGFSQPWDEILKVLSPFEIPMLEDNAYSLFSSYKQRPLGTFGDAAIFSLRKNIPLINGGLLRINNSQFISKVPCPCPTIYVRDWMPTVSVILKKLLGAGSLFSFLRHFYRKVRTKAWEPPPLFSDGRCVHPYWIERDQIGKDFSRHYLREMSPWARRQLIQWLKLDYDSALRKRREAYQFISNVLDDVKGIQIIRPNLPPDVSPFCISMLISSNRDAILSELRKQFSVMAWPTLPSVILDQLQNFEDVMLLGQKILQLNLPLEYMASNNLKVYLNNLVQTVQRLHQRYY